MAEGVSGASRCLRLQSRREEPTGHLTDRASAGLRPDLAEMALSARPQWRPTKLEHLRLKLEHLRLLCKSHHDLRTYRGCDIATNEHGKRLWVQTRPPQTNPYRSAG